MEKDANEIDCNSQNSANKFHVTIKILQPLAQLTKFVGIHAYHPRIIAGFGYLEI